MQKILGHRLVAEAVGDPEVHVRVEGARKDNLALDIDLPLRLAQRRARTNGNDLFPFNGHAPLYDAGWRDHEPVLQDDIMSHEFPLLAESRL